MIILVQRWADIATETKDNFYFILCLCGWSVRLRPLFYCPRGEFVVVFCYGNLGVIPGLSQSHHCALSFYRRFSVVHPSSSERRRDSAGIRPGHLSATMTLGWLWDDSGIALGLGGWLGKEGGNVWERGFWSVEKGGRRSC